MELSFREGVTILVPLFDTSELKDLVPYFGTSGKTVIHFPLSYVLRRSTFYPCTILWYVQISVCVYGMGIMTYERVRAGPRMCGMASRPSESCFSPKRTPPADFEVCRTIICLQDAVDEVDDRLVLL